ncbi:CsiV family protein [Pseudomonas sp. AL 58]|uniref:CsiV family protein n=1 Tax=Pseudomonas sp. AL 58 TaxID=3104275 RepID=UPI002EB196E1|nr:CsiV family protein [Pseudomonas sp. AL 58]
MRLIRSLALLAALCSTSAFADGLYQIEMILVRQNSVPAITSQYAPEDWAADAKTLSSTDESKPAMNDEAAKLQADSQYTILLHKAWQQNLSAEPGKVAISDGKRHFGHFPVEGNLSLSDGRFISADANFWVNRFAADGSITQTEQFKQSNSNMRLGDLNYLDGGHLALLLKVTKL